MKKHIVGTMAMSALLLGACNEGTQQEVGSITVQSAQLSEQQKRVYYETYENIVASLNARSTAPILALVPIEQFEEADWVDIEQFETRAQERYEEILSVHLKEVNEHPANVSKTATLSIGGRQETVMIDAVFQTTIDEADDRVRFKAFDGILLHGVKMPGEWTTRVYKAVLADDRTSYTVSMDAQYTEAGIVTTHALQLTFHCAVVGTVR